MQPPALVAAVVACLVLLLDARGSWAKVYNVGEGAGFENGWGYVDYELWERMNPNIREGDILVFKYAKFEHDVVLMPDRQAYDTCDFSNAELVGRQETGYATYTLNRGAGYTYYFSCSFLGHCNPAKLKVKVTTVGGNGGGSGPIALVSPPPPKPPPPPSRRRRRSPPPQPPPQQQPDACPAAARTRSLSVTTSRAYNAAVDVTIITYRVRLLWFRSGLERVTLEMPSGCGGLMLASGPRKSTAMRAVRSAELVALQWKTGSRSVRLPPSFAEGQLTWRAGGSLAFVWQGGIATGAKTRIASFRLLLAGRRQAQTASSLRINTSGPTKTTVLRLCSSSAC